MRAKFINQNFRTPFATHSSPRNNQFKGKYPLNKIQYEDGDKPDSDDWDMPLPCPSCDKDTQSGFVDGVCKKCAEQGIWQDKFGTLHRQSSRIRHKVVNESKHKK